MPLILIVDDDEMICRTLSIALHGRGYDVVCAADARMAEQLVDAQRPDVIVTDIVMDVADGLELINSILQVRRLTVPIIAMSGVASAYGFDSLAIARRLGAVATLSKPFSNAMLFETVAHALKEPEPS
jgi:two-component system response regulator GlrR